MKKILSILFIGAIATFMACSEDEAIPDSPKVTAPDANEALIGEPIDFTFGVTIPGGYKSSSVTATAGTVSIKSEPSAGATSGDVVVTFSSDVKQLVTIKLDVTDNNNKVTQASAAVSVANTLSILDNIAANTTWTTGNTYILTKRIVVLSGATLTIQPGVVVKGEAGSEANASALIIARGAKIMAEGTSAEPIIMTSISDEIQPGETASPNLASDVNGLWGGLIVLGRAKISVSTNAEAAQIEGIPPSDTNGLYGGTNDADNSGVIRYVSIRHGGTNIGDGNEINGLTLGGVGSGTVIEYVEVVANQDDGIEFFGGTVNVTNALVWNAGDDAIDTDQSWAGTLSNFIVIAGDDTDHTLEIDGPEGNYLAAHTVQNGSIQGNAASELGDFREGARGTFKNIFFFGFPDPATPDGSGGTLGRGDLSLSGTGSTDNFTNGILVFDKLENVLAPLAAGGGNVTLSSVFKNGTATHATAVTTGNNTVGADKTKFTWTWASADGQLAAF